MVTFVPGEDAIECRRAPGRCKGAFACKFIDKSLLDVTRYELDPASRDAVLSAQADTRRNDGTTPEQSAAMLVLPLRSISFFSDLSCQIQEGCQRCQVQRG